MNLVKFAAIAAVAVGAASSAHALTSTQTFYTGTAPYTTPPATPQSFPFTDTLAVQQFNPILGSLNSVTVTANGQILVAARVTNITATAANYSNTTANAAVSLTGGGLNFSQVFSAGGPYAGTVAGNTTVTAGQASSALAASTVSTTPSSYVGTGSTPVSVTFGGGSVSASGTGVDNVTFFGGTASATATITVTYDYNAPPPVVVPEPMSLALLGAGLAGIGFIRRRRA